MDLVKIEIDGRRIIADNRQSILEVARQAGVGTIPTLCHDGQLEPFASCFLCVVKVRGARTLLPACSTRISAGMKVETDTAEIRASRKAALELILSNHYADCIGPCQIACPASVDVQGYIALAALGKYQDALRLIKERNPLPAICGRICTRPCEVRGCRRSLLDEPVGIDYIKRYVADLFLGEAGTSHPPVAAATGKRIAVVGAGPAGLSCAYFLALRGHAVRVFECLPEAGGMLRYGIPEYRLPKEVLDLEVNQILDLGVTLSTNVALGRDFTVTSLKRDGFDAVFLGLGAWDSTRLRVQDEESEGVLAGIEFLKQFGLRNPIRLPGRVLVVGGGNTAIDCARTALRVGASEVTLLYRRTRTEMPANDLEIREAEREGVRLEFLVAPVRVLRDDGRVCALECIRMELGDPDASGRRSPKPVRGSEFTIAGDWVLAAVGQGTRVRELLDGRVPNFLPFGESLHLTRWQTIQVDDRTFETSVDGVFSGGDVVTGAATAIEGVAAGRKAAYAIDRFLATGRPEPEPVEVASRKDAYREVTAADLPRGPREARRPMPTLPVEESRRSFAEVEQGYTVEDLRKESLRCLECGCSALFDCDLRRLATEYRVDLSSFRGAAREHPVDRSHPLLELDPNKCILCGRCVRVCADVVGVAAYGFVNRGFDAVVRPALGGSLLETGCVSCGLCVETCPTGAIAERLPLVKPGPWRTASVPTVCHYCGAGCRLHYETFGTSLIRVSRAEDGSVTFGNHCRKGRFGYRYVQSRDRLTAGRIRLGRELEDATLEETIRHTAIRLKEYGRRFSGDEVAVFVSPRMTNEEIYLAQKLARIALRTANVTTFARVVNPETFTPEVISTASYADVADAQVILLVNSNLDEEQFVVDLLVKRAVRKGARLLFIGPPGSPAARHAEVFLRTREGGQTFALAEILHAVRTLAPDAFPESPELARFLAEYPPDRLAGISGVDPESTREAASILAGSLLKVLVFNKDYRGLRTVQDDRFFAEAADVLGASLLALREKANMQGLLDMGASPTWLPGYHAVEEESAVDRLAREWCVPLPDLRRKGGDVAALLRARKVKVAVVLGEDPVGCDGFPRDLRDGLLAADFLVVGDHFATATTDCASVVLPLSSAAETRGTRTSLERRVQRLERAVPPVAGMETWQILCRIAERMGYRFRMKYGSVDEVTAEIRRVVPIYRDVAIGSRDADGLWDRSAFPLARVSPHAPGIGRLVKPKATLALDDLERRFTRWFEGSLAGARRSLEAERAREAEQAPPGAGAAGSREETREPAAP